MGFRTKCANCGGTDVQTVMWVRPNIDKIVDHFGSYGDPDYNWCDDCEDHVLLEDEETPEGETVIKAHEARVSPEEAKEGFWLTVGKASLHIKDGDEGISLTVYRLDHEDEESRAELWVLNSELENESD